MDYYQEAPPTEAKRRMKQGHSLTKPEQVSGLPGFFVIRCECAWFTTGLWEDKERFEHLAWLHITEPMLLVPGSSDILAPMRMATLRDIERFG